MQKRIPALDLLLAVAIAALCLIGFYNRLLFHSLAEMFRISVAVAIFMLVWNVRRSLDNTYLMMVSVAYVFVSGLDILHTIAYGGMAVFRGAEANLAAQLWIAARYLEAAALLAASFFISRKIKLRLVVLGYAAATALLLGTIIYRPLFPAALEEGAEPTFFFRTSEFLVLLLFAAAVVNLVKKRDQFDPTVLRLVVTSISFAFLSELSLALPVQAGRVPYLLGHLFKIISFYFIYKAIIETGLAKPLSVLFRNLKTSEEALRLMYDELDIRVQERTQELAEANDLLRREVEERRRIEDALLRSEDKYRTVADNTYDWEWWRDSEGRFIYSSPSCQRITHHEAAEFIADPGLLHRIIHPDDRSSFLTHQKEVEQEALSGEFEFRILRPDGAVRWLAHACQPVLDESGRLRGRRGSNRDVTIRKTAEDALRESDERLRQLSSRILTAQETERKRIAHELHDELGGALAVLKLRTSFIEKNLPKNRVELKEAGRQSLDDIDRIIDSLARLSRDLSPSILEDIGLTPALRWLVDNFVKNYRIELASEITDLDHLFPRNSQIMIYRIFQEALTNIGKHAKASKVSIRVREEGEAMAFFIEDDGRGFDLKAAAAKGPSEKGLGLATMRERARMLGGSLDLSSEQGQGTRIILRIPTERGKGR